MKDLIFNSSFLKILSAFFFSFSFFVFTKIIFLKINQQQKIEKKFIRRINLIIILLSISIFNKTSGIILLQTYANGIIFFLILLFSFGVLEYLIIDLFFIRYKKKNVSELLRNLVRGSIIIILFMLLLKFVFGFNLGGIAVSSALLTAIIGFGLQDMIAQISTGIAIHIEKPFGIGDWISIKGLSGKVSEITWRTTKIKTIDNNFVIIPNKYFNEAEMINYSTPTNELAMNITIGVSYKHPPNIVKDTIIEAISNVHGVLSEPLPNVQTIRYNDFTIDYNIKYWINDYSNKIRINDEIMSSIWYAFKRNALEIPFPIRTIYTKKQKLEKYLSKIEKLAFLKSLDIFKNLSKSFFDTLSAKIIEEKWGKGEVICKQNTQGNNFYIIYSGHVSIQLKISKKKIEIIDRIGKGNFFSEISLLLNIPHMATVIAEEELTLLRINRDTMAELLKKSKKFRDLISKTVEMRVKNLQSITNKYKTTDKLDIPKKAGSSFINKQIKAFFELG